MLLILSLLAMLETIPVLLNRLKSLLNQTFHVCVHERVCEKSGQPLRSLFNKTGIVSSVAKSDEIGKKAHLIWCKK